MFGCLLNKSYITTAKDMTHDWMVQMGEHKTINSKMTRPNLYSATPKLFLAWD